MHPLDEANQTLVEAASRLAGEAVVTMVPAGAGANSHVLRVTTPSRTLGLKCYPYRPGDPRDRLDVEWRALRFLRGIGLEAVPEALGRDDANQLMLMEWIDGQPMGTHSPVDIDAALRFIAHIFQASTTVQTAGFTLASEACLSVAEINRQIETRLAALAPHPMLQVFLDNTFSPAFATARSRIASELDGGRDLPVSLRRLIPADFGFHNALRQCDGRLRFIDFDYFGWDDPVKMAADFVLHPAMSLGTAEKHFLVAQLAAAVPKDTAFRDRLVAHMPLYALRWALILLNLFRVDRMDVSAEYAPGYSERLQRQIEKAERMCSISLEEDIG
jgi:phosphotransferase family enzyme